jgi:hypothetical protein
MDGRTVRCSVHRLCRGPFAGRAGQCHAQDDADDDDYDKTDNEARVPDTR